MNTADLVGIADSVGSGAVTSATAIGGSSVGTLTFWVLGIALFFALAGLIIALVRSMKKG